MARNLSMAVTAPRRTSLSLCRVCSLLRSKTNGAEAITEAQISDDKEQGSGMPTERCVVGHALKPASFTAQASMAAGVAAGYCAACRRERAEPGLNRWEIEERELSVCWPIRC